jgi:DNA modification methylase
MADIEVDWHHGDCRDVLVTLPDRSIDAVFCDPPYPEISRDYGRMTEKDWHAMMRSVVTECRRVLKPKGSAAFVLQPNYSKIGKTRLWFYRFALWAGEYWNIVEDAYWWNFSTVPNAACQEKHGLMRRSVKSIVWLGDPDCYRDQDSGLWTESDSSRASRYNDRFMRYTHPSGYTVDRAKCSAIVHARGGVTPFNLMPIANANSVNGAGSLGHGAGTPIQLSDWWVRYLCPPGGVVLDPFMGTGTTGKSAIRQGRGFVGIEKDRKHFETAEKILSVEILSRSNVVHA